MLKRQISVSDFYGLNSIMQHFGRYYICKIWLFDIKKKSMCLFKSVCGVYNQHSFSGKTDDAITTAK